MECWQGVKKVTKNLDKSAKWTFPLQVCTSLPERFYLTHLSTYIWKIIRGQEKEQQMNLFHLSLHKFEQNLVRKEVP